MGLIRGTLVVSVTHVLCVMCTEHVRGRKFVVWEEELGDGSMVIDVATVVMTQILARHTDLT